MLTKTFLKHPVHARVWAPHLIFSCITHVELFCKMQKFFLSKTCVWTDVYLGYDWRSDINMKSSLFAQQRTEISRNLNINFYNELSTQTQAPLATTAWVKLLNHKRTDMAKKWKKQRTGSHKDTEAILNAIKNSIRIKNIFLTNTLSLIKLRRVFDLQRANIKFMFPFERIGPSEHTDLPHFPIYMSHWAWKRNEFIVVFTPILHPNRPFNGIFLTHHPPNAISPLKRWILL